MAYPTKDQLIMWRQQGKTYKEIAQMTGKSPETIRVRCCQYKITSKPRGMAQDQIDVFCRMRREGLGTKEIADQTGYAESTVYTYLKAAGLIKNRNFEPDLPLKFAVPREKKIIKAVFGGVKYEDITDFCVPG